MSLRRPEEGIPLIAIREIKSLQAIDEHENIVALRGYFAHGSGFIMEFEYMPSDLNQVPRALMCILPVQGMIIDRDYYHYHCYY
jgi:hypothetical protein